MTSSPTPSNPPSQAAPPPRPEPNCALVVMCIECGDGLELPLPIDNRTIGLLLAQRGWFISVLSRPNDPNRVIAPGQGPETPMVLGPLCTACAQQVYPPEVFAAAEQRRQQFLQAAATPQGPR